MTLNLNAGDAALPTNDPGILVNTPTQLKLTLSAVTADASTVIRLSQTGSGGCQYATTSGGTYAATLDVTFGTGDSTKNAIYVKCGTAHATGSQLVATKHAGTQAWDTKTSPNMAVASTLAGSITVTKNDDGVLPTNDPGILVNTAQQLKITLGYASIGVTTVSMSMSTDVFALVTPRTGPLLGSPEAAPLRLVQVREDRRRAHRRRGPQRREGPLLR